MDTGLRRYDGVCGDIQQKNRPVGGEIRFLRQSPKALAMGDDNWIYSGDDLLFRGLSQSTIGDTGFPCLVRDGTEGGSRSIITRINPANIIILF